MLQPDPTLKADSLLQGIGDLFSTAASKIRHITSSTTLQCKTPVFTIDGKYVPQGWTEWTQGFQYGAAILTFDAINDQELLEIGRQAVLAEMPPHVTHFGVHDHGFNNVSTYAALRRLMTEGRLPHDEYERHFYELALMASGAVQANRWIETADGEGFIYSFNGPHSLFCDTIRSLRSLAMAHLLGHSILDENDHP